MLYYAYQAQRDAFTSMQLMAEAFRGIFDPHWPLIGDLPVVRQAAAAMTMLSHAGISHEHPPFGIDQVTIGGEAVAVAKEVEIATPFCDLLHFRKATQNPAGRDEPKLLMVAPLSGHFSTLLRGTVATALPDHDVYLTDWINARNVPLRYGRFGLDDFVDVIIQFIRLLGPNLHGIAVCQPSVPVLAAVSMLAAANDPYQPAT